MVEYKLSTVFYGKGKRYRTDIVQQPQGCYTDVAKTVNFHTTQFPHLFKGNNIAHQKSHNKRKIWESVTSLSVELHFVVINFNNNNKTTSLGPGEK